MSRGSAGTNAESGGGDPATRVAAARTVDTQTADSQTAVTQVAVPMTFAHRVRRSASDHLAILRGDRLLWVAGLSAAFVLTASRYHATTSEYRRLIAPKVGSDGLFAWLSAQLFGDGAITAQIAHLTSATAPLLYWFTSSSALFVLIPVVAVALTPGVKISELGFGLGDVRYGLRAAGLLYLLMLPFVVAVSFSPAFHDHYPLARGAASGWGPLLVFESAYWLYFIAWEFVYRGLLCVALYPRIGASVLVLHTIPFAVMHGGKPEAEAFGSIVAGIALGLIAVRARSFWYGVLLHGAVASTMDFLALWQSGRLPVHW